MITRAAAAVITLVALVVVLVPAAPAGAIDRPPPGWVSENQSEFGEARIAGTPDGLLITRPAYELVQRWDFRAGRDPVVLASGISGIHLVAWDPSTDGAIVTTTDGRVLRIADGQVTTIASGLIVIDSLAVDHAGNAYVDHFVSPTDSHNAVSRIAPNGTRTTLVDDLEYVTSLAIAPDGDLLIGALGGLYRYADGDLEHVSDSRGCQSPDPCGDEGPVRDARFAEITSMVVGEDGSIYTAEHRNARVRVIRPDGTVHNLLGSFQECIKRERFDCLPGSGPRSAMQKPLSLALSGRDLFVIDQDDARRWTRLLQLYDPDLAPAVAPQGYRMLASDGGVFAFGWSPFHGSTGDLRLASPIVAGVSNGASGYWFVAGDGGVFTFGDAGFFGSAAGATTSPVVDMARTPTGQGYWLLERGGRVHAFGDAPALGPAPDAGPYAALVRVGDGSIERVRTQPPELPRLNTPILHARATSSGNGRWLVAADGGVFTEGDATFFGSTGALRLNQPVVDLVPTPTDGGYWLVARDGGVFSFGDARFLGSMGAVRLNRPVVAGMSGPEVSR